MAISLVTCPCNLKLMARKPYQIGFGGRAKSRHGSTRPGEMNRTEAKYADYLEKQRLAGEIVKWGYEKLKLRLGQNWKTTYTPDFLVITNDLEIEFHDCKGGGGWEEDARVKIKVAAEQFPEFLFVGMTLKKGRWECEIISKESSDEKARNRKR